jgi:hypothetical protein
MAAARSASDLIAFNHAGSVSSSVRFMVLGMSRGSQPSNDSAVRSTAP